MEGIQSSTQPKKYVYSKYGTFLDISHELKKVEGPVDTTNWTTVPWYDRNAIQRDLRPGRLEMQASRGVGSTATAAAAALKQTNAVRAEAKSAVGKFYDGSISEDELQTEYERLAARYVEAFRSSGYPDRLCCHAIQYQLGAEEVFYDEFRKAALEMAVSRNNAEAKQYITGESKNNRTVKYYNSDYYYKSQAAIAAITKGAYAVGAKSKEQCSELGWDEYEFEVPDYKANKLNLYYNFNSAWSNNFLASEQYITDYDQVPPKNFQWFYEAGRRGSDFENTNTASTWARYRDETGMEHFISKIFNYVDGGKGLFQVSELLKFTTGDCSRFSEVNRFLNSLQVFKSGYFALNYAKAGGISFLA